MTAGSNPTADRSKQGKAKRHILTDKNGIPLSVVISSASTHDVKLVTDVIDYAVIKRHISPSRTKNVRKRKQHIYVLIKHIIPNLKNTK